jgi:hypothetical protein
VHLFPFHGMSLQCATVCMPQHDQGGFYKWLPVNIAH